MKISENWLIIQSNWYKLGITKQSGIGGKLTPSTLGLQMVQETLQANKSLWKSDIGKCIESQLANKKYPERTLKPLKGFTLMFTI